MQIADERFLVFLNDLLASGNIPGLFAPEEVDEIIDALRPAPKREGRAHGTRAECYEGFIRRVREHLHAILCFSPIGEAIKVRIPILTLTLALTLTLTPNPPSMPPQTPVNANPTPRQCHPKPTPNLPPKLLI